MGLLSGFAAAAARGGRAAGGAALAGDAAARGHGGGAVEAAMDLQSESATVRDSQGHLNVDASARNKNFRNGARCGPAHASGAIGKVALPRASRGADVGSARPNARVIINGLITSTRLGKGSRRRTGNGEGGEGGKGVQTTRRPATGSATLVEARVAARRRRPRGCAPPAATGTCRSSSACRASAATQAARGSSASGAPAARPP